MGGSVEVSTGGSVEGSTGASAGSTTVSSVESDESVESVVVPPAGASVDGAPVVVAAIGAQIGGRVTAASGAEEGEGMIVFVGMEETVGSCKVLGDVVEHRSVGIMVGTSVALDRTGDGTGSVGPVDGENRKNFQNFRGLEGATTK